jgi:uncharacterized protein YcbK (DUF882 family)
MYSKKKNQISNSSFSESNQSSSYNYGSNSNRAAMLQQATSQTSNNSSINSFASNISNIGNEFQDVLNLTKLGLLTSEEEHSATRYNNLQGFRKGSIKRYQRIINTQDDGIFGPKTAGAIALFQMQSNLTIDGKIGPSTQRVLEQESPEATIIQMNQVPEEESQTHTTEPLSDGQLTQNFSLSEFESNDGAQTPSDVIPILHELAEQLEVLKAALGGANINISSGYRSESHNHTVGGVKNSQHLLGRAADIKVNGYSPGFVQDKIDHLMNTGKMKLGGLGRYATFTHYDTRGHRAEWNG